MLEMQLDRSHGIAFGQTSNEDRWKCSLKGTPYVADASSRAAVAASAAAAAIAVTKVFPSLISAME